MPDAMSISVGNELLNGKTINGNASYVGRELYQIGVPVKYALTIRDEPAQINAALQLALSKFDTTVVTGGLGPTADDLTRSAIADFFGRELVFREDIYSDIEARFQRSGQSLPLSNKSQAMFPEGAVFLSNAVGTAPGILMEHNGKSFFFLPGVPAEMKAMFATHVIPYLLKHHQLQPPEVKLYRTTGIAESRLAERCQPIFDRYPQLEIAYLPRSIGVDIRVACDAATSPSPIDSLEKELKSVAGEYIFEEGPRNLETVVGDMLTQKSWTIATAESCTGGLIANRLTDIAGSSAYFLGGFVTYSNASKMAELGVKSSDLDTHGAVSEAVAAQMAEGARKKLGASIGLSTTGIAGPGGATAEKPVGLVYIGIATEEKAVARRFFFGKDRLLNKAWSAQAALELCRRTMLQI